MLNDVIASAEKYKKQLPREIMAHRLSAEGHRRWNMRLGGVAASLTTLVGTAVFTALVSRFGLDPSDGNPAHPLAFQGFQGPGMKWLYGGVLIVSIVAPVIATLYTFRHDAGDAAAHQASAAGYTGVLTRLTIFLAKYGDHTLAPEKADEALQAYGQVMTEYGSVLEKSITLTKNAFKHADRLMQVAEPDGAKEKALSRQSVWSWFKSVWSWFMPSA